MYWVIVLSVVYSDHRLVFFFCVIICLCSRSVILRFPPSVVGLLHAQRISLLNKERLSFVNNLVPVFYQSSSAKFCAELRDLSEVLDVDWRVVLDGPYGNRVEM